MIKKLNKINKKYIIGFLAVLFLVQTGLYSLLTIYSTTNRKLRRTEKKLLQGITIDKISNIEISDKNGKSFTLTNDSTIWTVSFEGSKIPADMDKISNYVDDLKSMPKGVVVYKGKDYANETKFGLDNVNGQIVKVNLKNNTSYSIFVGNNIGSNKSYIMLENENAVREVESKIAKLTYANENDWAKLNIFDNIKLEDIQKINYSAKLDWFTGQYQLLFSTEDGLFNLSNVKDGFTENSAEINNVIDKLTSLKAEQYKIGGIQLSADMRKASIEAVLSNGETFKLDFYKSVPEESYKGEYVLKLNSTSYLFYISENSFNRIFKSADSLMKPQVSSDITEGENP